MKKKSYRIDCTTADLEHFAYTNVFLTGCLHTAYWCTRGELLSKKKRKKKRRVAGRLNLALRTSDSPCAEPLWAAGPLCWSANCPHPHPCWTLSACSRPPDGTSQTAVHQSASSQAHAAVGTVWKGPVSASCTCPLVLVLAVPVLQMLAVPVLWCQC